MVATAILPDLPTTEDHLDFGASAAALAGIVGDEGTATPITVGVFGTWGTGKTSLMRMIEAARGSDGRQYPWGNEFDPARCNSGEGGPGETTPVGQYPEGASPYGILDMAGNVWEWCSTLYKPYPYDPGDGRENPEAEGGRMVRGGSFLNSRWGVRCAVRLRLGPDLLHWYQGFCPVASPVASEL